ERAAREGRRGDLPLHDLRGYLSAADGEAGAGPGPARRRLRPAGALPLDHGRSRAGYPGGAEGVCRGARGRSGRLGVPDGVAGGAELGEANRRAEEQVILQRKIAAYRQFQHDATGQLYSVASALLVPDDRQLDATLRQLNQFGYDFDRLQFVANDEVELFGQV